jgi:hypothetical protein
MQRRFLKIVLGVIVLLFISTVTLRAQVSSFRLKEADSLYQDKKYTQSLEHYRTILSQREYSPAMLLKMAYIQEGLNHIGQALYYLNLYYLVTNDKSVLGKMEEVATRYNLEGYENTDTDRVLSFYRDYYFHISLALAVVALFLVSLAFSIQRKGQRPVASGIFTFLVLLTLFFHINWGGEISMGIVGSSNAFLMDGPSPGASVIDVVDEGHRVEIVGKKDVWLQVLWNGEVAYIKESNLLPVRL